ncbi:hypothetical protein KHQ84_gp044 [Rhodococcus phage Finch]|uniref:Uncharacterized protein n=1 Tax=Rhodococcus phage Finch TaxID=2094144 RepID=A0A2P1JXE4_9CAUD|nr:hypothetical protein KHQ84_gp044 [Rhodococcus phage Finch]AVO24984.1 hypothetical protein SEA_FINCH_44 [Rhodococcus phage Finch]
MFGYGALGVVALIVLILLGIYLVRRL